MFLRFKVRILPPSLPQFRLCC